eukprot:TRINITY_DN12394_c0_g1_i1.p1 TRINITY_DN12394_c0_g1~~TRINITY_DN12394_c0_g1_i1.p1  ORF type:complete len:300 (+),score=84.76 TRINITY_DN12394_c0_g1_i1:109-1008(+)
MEEDNFEEDNFLGNFEQEESDEDTNKLTREQLLKIVPKDPINIKEKNWFLQEEKKKLKEQRSILTFHYFKKNYEQCVELCNEMLEKLGKEKNSARKNRNIEDVLETLVRSYIEIKQYDLALESLDKLMPMIKNMNTISTKYYLKANCLIFLERDEEAFENLESCLQNNPKDVSAMVLLAEKYANKKMKFEISFYCLLKAKRMLYFDKNKKSTLWSFSNSDISDRFWNTYDFVLYHLKQKSPPLKIDEEDVLKYKGHLFFEETLLNIQDIFVKVLNGETTSLENDANDKNNLEERNPLTL